MGCRLSISTLAIVRQGLLPRSGGDGVGSSGPLAFVGGLLFVVQSGDGARELCRTDLHLDVKA